jgi:hypothetical protein
MMNLYSLVWFTGLFNSLAGVFIHSDWLWIMRIAIMTCNFLGWLSNEK